MEDFVSQRKRAIATFLSISSAVLLALPIFYESLWFLVFFSLIPLFLLSEYFNRTIAIVGSLAVGFVYLTMVFYPLSTLNTWWWTSYPYLAEHKSTVFFLFALLISLIFSIITFVTTFFIYSKFLNQKQLLTIIGTPIVWVTTEIARAKILSGIEWGMIGHPLANSGLLIHTAKYGGIFGMSFVVVIVNICIFLLIKNYLNKTSYTKFVLPTMVICLLIGTLGIFSGLQKENSRVGNITFAIISPNVETSDLLNENEFEKVIDLIRGALENSPDIIVTPENIFPDLVIDEQEKTPTNKSRIVQDKWQTLTTLSLENPKTTFIIGLHSRKNSEEYNSAVALENGKVVSVYNKINLVPFTEKAFWPINSQINRLSAGNERGFLQIQHGKLGVLICSEALVHQEKTADLNINLSNDNIFESQRYKGYVKNSLRIRAIQTGVPIIRASKGGYSGLFDEYEYKDKTITTTHQ